MIRTKFISSLFLSVSVLSLAACTQKYQDVNATLNEALFGFDSVNKSKQEILAIPYATTYVTIDDGAQIFMVLALAEASELNRTSTQLKWLSSDYGMLVTENGRLVKTLKLPKENLAGIHAIKTVDPLSIQGKKPGYLKWIAGYDWQPGYRYGYTAELEWRFISSTSLATDVEEKSVNYYQETVTFSSIDETFINHYWLDKKTHRVVKSIQFIGPDMPKVEMTVLKPYQG